MGHLQSADRIGIMDPSVGAGDNIRIPDPTTPGNSPGTVDNTGIPVVPPNPRDVPVIPDSTPITPTPITPTPITPADPIAPITPDVPVEPLVGVSDPNPTPLPGGTPTVRPPYGQPPSPPSAAPGPSVQDLYPGGGTGSGGDGNIGDIAGADPGDYVPPAGADVTETDSSVTNVDTTGAADSTGRIGGLLDAGAAGIDASQTDLTDEQRVDAELTRILGEDSPLLAQARADAARYANTRGLQNTTMAAGMATDAMVRAALPMAQQNAQQGFQREMSNTALEQRASEFSAEQQNQLAGLEAELGQRLNVFNAEQLNRASEIMAQMRTALEQQDASAYNAASTQLASLQRDAQAQQSELDYRASQEEANAINQRNTQVIDSVTRLNQQFLQNMGNADIANIQGTYQQLISTNQAAGSIFNSVLSAMGQLMDNPDMTPQQVATGLSSMQSMLEASLRMLSNINNMDFGADVGGIIPGNSPPTFPQYPGLPGGPGAGPGNPGTPGNAPFVDPNAQPIM